MDNVLRAVFAIVLVFIAGVIFGGATMLLLFSGYYFSGALAFCVGSALTAWILTWIMEG